MEDLSHVYANADTDAAQENHGNLPHDLKMHMFAAFAHKAGIAPHPGVYKGPPVQIPPDFETPADEFGQVAENRAESIANPTDFGNPPVIPSSAPAPKTASSSSAPKPGQPVSEAFKNWNTDPNSPDAK